MTDSVGVSSIRNSIVLESASDRPVGVVAALLALTLTLLSGLTSQVYAVRLARQYVREVAAAGLPATYESLTFQRAALADAQILPMYGSSELYRQGGPFLAPRFFATAPTGFVTVAFGRAGTAELYFAQTFAALGYDLRGKKLVLSQSPPWFIRPDGIDPAFYGGTFSPEVAEMFVFDAPIPLQLREMGARRMLDYPKTLEGQDLLRIALEDLADPTPPHLLTYYVLYPAGRIDSWIHQLQDTWGALQFMRQHPELHRDPPVETQAIDWTGMVSKATQVAEQGDTSNPFGFTDDAFHAMLSADPQQMRQALSLYCSGHTNRDGEIYPDRSDWAQGLLGSKGWADLGLELGILREFGAQPLMLTSPLPGVYYDYTVTTFRARQLYYWKYQNDASLAHVPAVAFEEHDEDRYFVPDTGGHYSARGWVFVDLVLDRFWHGQSVEDIRSSLIDLNSRSPSIGLPDSHESAMYCH